MKNIIANERSIEACNPKGAEPQAEPPSAHHSCTLYHTTLSLSLSLYIYIYIYVYIVWYEGHGIYIYNVYIYIYMWYSDHHYSIL